MTNILDGLLDFVNNGLSGDPELMKWLWLVFLILGVIGLVYFLFFYIKEE